MISLIITALNNAGLTIANMIIKLVLGTGELYYALFGVSAGISNPSVAGTYIPYIKGFYEFISYVGWGILLINIFVASAKYISAPVAGSSIEPPLNAVLRFVIVALLIKFRTEILSTVSMLMNWVGHGFIGYMRLSPAAFSSWDLGGLKTGTIGLSLTLQFILFGLYTSLSASIIAACLMYFERFFVTIFYMYLFPVAAGFYAGSETKSVLGDWFKGLMSQMAVLIISLFFIYNGLYAILQSGELAGLDALLQAGGNVLPSEATAKITYILIAAAFFAVSASCDRILATFGFRVPSAGGVASMFKQGLGTALTSAVTAIGLAGASFVGVSSGLDAFKTAKGSTIASPMGISLGDKGPLPAGLSAFRTKAQADGANTALKNLNSHMNEDGSFGNVYKEPAADGRKLFAAGAVKGNLRSPKDLEDQMRNNIRSSRRSANGIVDRLGRGLGERSNLNDQIKGAGTALDAVQKARDTVNEAVAAGAAYGTATVPASTLMTAAGISEKDLGFKPKEGASAQLVSTRDGRKGWALSDTSGNAHILTASGGYTIGGKTSWGLGNLKSSDKDLVGSYNSFSTVDGGAGDKMVGSGLRIYSVTPTYGMTGKDSRAAQASTADEHIGNTILSNIGANPKTATGISIPAGYESKTGTFGPGSYISPNASSLPDMNTTGSKSVGVHDYSVGHEANSHSQPMMSEIQASALRSLETAQSGGFGTRVLVSELKTAGSLNNADLDLSPSSPAEHAIFANVGGRSGFVVPNADGMGTMVSITRDSDPSSNASPLFETSKISADEMANVTSQEHLAEQSSRGFGAAVPVGDVMKGMSVGTSDLGFDPSEDSYAKFGKNSDGLGGWYIPGENGEIAFVSISSDGNGYDVAHPDNIDPAIAFPDDVNKPYTAAVANALVSAGAEETTETYSKAAALVDGALGSAAGFRESVMNSDLGSDVNTAGLIGAAYVAQEGYYAMNKILGSSDDDDLGSWDAALGNAIIAYQDGGIERFKEELLHEGTGLNGITEAQAAAIASEYDKAYTAFFGPLHADGSGSDSTMTNDLERLAEGISPIEYPVYPSNFEPAFRMTFGENPEETAAAS